MDAIFINSENSKPSDPHRLLRNISEWKILNYMIDHILYQILKIIISIPSKNMRR